MRGDCIQSVVCAASPFSQRAALLLVLLPHPSAPPGSSRTMPAPAIWQALKLGQWQFSCECADPCIQSRGTYWLFLEGLCYVASFLDRRGYLVEKGARRSCHDSSKPVQPVVYSGQASQWYNPCYSPLFWASSTL